MANYKGEMYNMPFNMNTFSKMWGISTPDEAKAVIEKQRAEIKEDPQEPGGAGDQPGWTGTVRKTDQGVYGKTVGQGLQGASGLYHQAHSCAVYL